MHVMVLYSTCIRLHTRLCFTWIVSFMFMISCIHVFMYIPVIYACYSPLADRHLQTKAKQGVSLTPGWSARRTQTADHGLSPLTLELRARSETLRETNFEEREIDP